MKELCALLLCLNCFTSLLSQRSAPDTVRLGSGKIVIHPVFHGALALEWEDQMIYVDPYGGPRAFEGLRPPDMVLFTDVHPDHLDTSTLAALDLSRALLIMPDAVFNIVPKRYKKDFQILANGHSSEARRVRIQAMPMYNLPDDASSTHPKGRGNGYVLTFNNHNVYISGDTEDIPEMRELKNIDVAFVCMNLPYTMDVNQAASAVLQFKPRMVYPYHYRGKDGLSDTKAFSELVKKGDAQIEVRLRDWYSVKPK